MNLKRLISMGLILTITTSTLVGCSSNNESEETTDNGSEQLKVTLVADAGGINDQSFNQSAWEGLQKAGEDFDIEINVFESKQSADYLSNIENAIDGESDLIIGVGFQMQDAVKEAAENYPDKNFALIDASFGDEQPENLNSLMFNAQEAAYLVGLIAAKKSETGKVGFIGGKKTPIIESFEYGFLAGIEAAGSTTLLRQYADTYSDAAKGKAIAMQMYANNADVIFTAAGSTGNGSIEASREANKMAIGVDRDQNSLAPDNVITSAIKRVDQAVYSTVEDLVNDEFKRGEISVFGLSEDGVGIAPTTSNLVDKDILSFVEEHAEKIKNGEIKVPATEEEYNNLKK